MQKQHFNNHSKPFLWKVCSDYPLKFYLIEDEAIIYFGGSGNTHHLNFLAYKILVCIKNSPYTSNQEIEDSLINELTINIEKKELTQYITGVLNQFSAMGLIEKHSS